MALGTLSGASTDYMAHAAQRSKSIADRLDFNGIAGRVFHRNKGPDRLENCVMFGKCAVSWTEGKNRIVFRDMPETLDAMQELSILESRGESGNKAFVVDIPEGERIIDLKSAGKGTAVNVWTVEPGAKKEKPEGYIRYYDLTGETPRCVKTTRTKYGYAEARRFGTD